MYIHLTLLFIAFFLYKISSRATLHQLRSKRQVPPSADGELVRMYQEKPKYDKRVVIIIESFRSTAQLLQLLRQILRQEIKVDSIVLVTQDSNISSVELVGHTCIINKVGGLSFLFKESGDDTVLVFIFSNAGNVFSNPRFLKQLLDTDDNVNGVVQLKTSTVKIDVRTLYPTFPTEVGNSTYSRLKGN